MRDTPYARELARTNVYFNDGSEGRIERLLFKESNSIGYRFSWWKNGKMVPRPLDAEENELKILLKNAIEEKIFSEDILNTLKEVLKN